MTWEDERYMDGNELRIADCPSNYVVWTAKNQFWIPNLAVLNYLTLVTNDQMIELITKPKHLVSFFQSQEGFLKQQDEPGSQGDRQLTYDVNNGRFYLTTKSYARVYCDMDFAMYPFDTQKCKFAMIAARTLKYQASRVVFFFVAAM